MHQADYRLLFEGSTLFLEREIKLTGIFPSLMFPGTKTLQISILNKHCYSIHNLSVK